MKIPLKLALDQLGCVYRTQPTFPGDTLSHQAANECRKRYWITRDHDGNWVTTKLGNLIYWICYWWTRRG